MNNLRPKLTYANVVATLALFVALGGTSYAATKIGTRQIANNSIRTQDIRNGTIRGRDLRRGVVGGREVRESRLGKVPSSANADLLGGQSPAGLRQRCPAGTVSAVGLCFEPGLRAAQSVSTAGLQCALEARRLATAGELESYRGPSQELSAVGEWTSELAGSAAAPSTTSALVHRNDDTGLWLPATGNTQRQYRCVTDPRD